MSRACLLRLLLTVTRTRSRICGAALVAMVAACDKEPAGPEPLEPGDTAQTRGTLLARGAMGGEDLVWVPGTDLVAFNYRRPAGGGYALETVDATSGTMTAVDGACVHLLPDRPYFRGLVAAPDGHALYYSAGCGNSANPDWQLRVADLTGGGTSTLRSGVAPPLAVSPDGRHLAYLAADSLLVRDLATGAERHHAAAVGPGNGPILFSPDGTELLFGWPLRRLLLSDGSSQAVSWPGAAFDALRFHWGASGIEAIAEVSLQDPSDYRVADLTTGVSVQVGAIRGYPWEIWIPGFEAWSADGTRVAYWTDTCFEFTASFTCGVERYALFVADHHAGTRVRVAYTSFRAGPVAFSPDGRRVLYHNSPGIYTGGEDGKFYVVQLP